MNRVNLEERMTIKTLNEKGVSHAEIGRILSVNESTVRHHLRRESEGVLDGRGRQKRLASGWSAAIEAWRSAQGESRGLNLKALHEYLVTEHSYPGSERSVQRYYRERYPVPRRRACRRVESPPGAQAQADWAEFRGIWLGGSQRRLYAFHLELSYSRYAAVVWSERKDQLSWLHCHNEALRRLGGVPATVRVDNEKTAVSRGAGAWGVLNEAYRRYALTARFHIDACPPRSPNYKGKVERGIREQRLRGNPAGRHWNTLGELQQWSDLRIAQEAHRRCCPSTGDSVRQSWEQERPYLGALPILPEPFDLAVTRRVREDCLVGFESRQYSVPFAYVGERVEVRGCAGIVQVWSGNAVIAEHERGTRRLLVLHPEHFEGEATSRVVPPTPLGRMGSRLESIASLAPEQRPLDLYAALAEVAR